MYVDNTARVKVNKLFTDWLNVSPGVRQGDNLSPVLFNLYINELAIELKKLNYGVDIGGKKVCLLLYADDIVIISENESDFQIQLDFINQWCKKWRLNINHNKSNVIHFRKRNDRQSNFVFLFGHLPIYTVQTYTYLEIVFDEHLTFSECIKTRTDAAGRALGGLISKCQKLKGLGYDSYCKLYDSLVVPVQDYGAEIWSIVNSKTAEKIHERAMRYYLGVHNLTPLPALYGEMGWSAVKYRHHVQILRFWNRLIKTPGHRLLKHIFQRDLALSTKPNWSHEVLKLFRLYDHFGDKNNPTICCLDRISKLTRELSEINWLNEVNQKPKLRTYILIKKTLNPSEYVKSYMSKHKRSLMAQSLTGILPLKIETGRFKKIRDTSSGKLRCLN